MSLTADVKAELTAVRDPRPTARVAELTSLLRFSGGLHSIANRVAVEAELDEKRRALGVEDDLREVEGITTSMMVALGENDVKSVEDLAGCATDDLIGWTERKDGEATRHAGYLDGFDLSRQDAEAIIMAARIRAGWVEAAAEEPEAEAGEAAEA